ncbi:MAG TPA: bifunctional phosphoglucose/phosphomannose isomerase [Acidimicrobiia bacterium]|nr:bifunctional phosphoglucose/phosphomannose isomerase [Acidimicrobiia bacterium]
MTDMIAQIRSLGDQLRWGADLEAPDPGAHAEILYAGMGGSGIAGDYAAAMTGPTSARIAVHKGYGPLPGWVERIRPLVVAASYSGNTEETLEVVTAAWEAGLPVATITTGGELRRLTEEYGWPTIGVPAGMQPRAAVGYMVGAVARMLQAAQALEDQRAALSEAADIADEAAAEGSARWEEAEGIAGALQGRIPIVYGAGPVSGAVAQRWKTQINENAKMPAWWSRLPELDHNEVTGWETLPDLTKRTLAIVALTDRSDHPRIAARLAHTRALTEDAVDWVGTVTSSGSSTLARLISLTVVGDLVSWMLAAAAGVDPVPVATIEKLKKLLAKEA